MPIDSNKPPEPPPIIAASVAGPSRAGSSSAPQKKPRHWSQWLMLAVVCCWPVAAFVFGLLAYWATGAQYRHVYGNIYINDRTQDTITSANLAASQVSAFIGIAVCVSGVFAVLTVVSVVVWLATRDNS